MYILAADVWCWKQKHDLQVKFPPFSCVIVIQSHETSDVIGWLSWLAQLICTS